MGRGLHFSEHLLIQHGFLSAEAIAVQMNNKANLQNKDI
jgi:hypothetical protein